MSVEGEQFATYMFVLDKGLPGLILDNISLFNTDGLFSNTLSNLTGEP